MARYVLVTPAHNEEDFLAKTIESVINQTCCPLKWIIVSDRSTDNTDAIAQRYAEQYDFITFIRKSHGNGRNTAAKVMTINEGLAQLQGLDYDYIGNLDADISFGPDYFAKLLQIFQDEPALGLIGGRIYHELNGRLVENKAALESVAGAVQFFRRECFEKIGGYLPIRGGLEDAVAELAVRYHGWQTRSIPGLVVTHHRPIGTVGKTIWHARFNNGLNEYIFCYRYYYHLLRLGYYLTEKPLILGSLVIALGYLYGLVTRKEKILPPYLLDFHRHEQKERVLARLFRR